MKKAKSIWTKILISILPFYAVSACAQEKKDVKDKNNFIEDQISKRKSFLLNDISPMFSKNQLEAKLMILSKAPVPNPDELSMGAMCYEMVMPADTASYICPVCSSRTLYKRDYSYKIIDYIEWEINAIKREAEKVEGINIEVVELEFCKSCSPDIEEPNLKLYTNIEGTNDTIINENISFMDIRLILEFLSGSLVHTGSQDYEEPLVEYTYRIEQLLGL